MSKRRFLGRLHSISHQKNIEVQVNIIEYKDEGIGYSYSPALDLIGYGSTQHEAGKSWEVVLEEYFKYTVNKKTLTKDLRNRGWIVRKGSKQFKPPALSWLLQNNNDLKEMYNKYDLQKTSKPIKVPLAYT